MTETATGRRTPDGVMTTAIPAAVHAGTSTLSYPTPKRATAIIVPDAGIDSTVKRGASRISP